MANNNALPAFVNDKSVGQVSSTSLHFDDHLQLACGQTLHGFDLTIETYGTLNADKSNAVLICHALSGSHHAAGFYSISDKKAGWWDNMIGKGKPVDTNRFFVVCLTNIGSCYGSTGPASINPDTNKAFGASFPVVTIEDWVRTQVILSDHLGIDCWHAVVGGSMGGMQAMRWATNYPNRLKKCVIIASTSKLSAQNIAFNEVARQSILSDPDFCNGDYLNQNRVPKKGLKLARMVGHITYLTDEAMKIKFGRDLKKGRLQFNYDADFQVESYLRYQGEQFSSRFDANSYLLMTKALDYFDLSKPNDENTVKQHDNSATNDKDALTLALKDTQCQFLIISFTTDWRFSPKCSQEIVDALLANTKPVSYINIDAPFGHDSFLFDIAPYHTAVRNFLQQGFDKPI